MAVVQDPDGNKIIIHKLKSKMITNEVAFIAIAVSDKERARKFYQETLELKPATTGMDGAWVEYESWPDDDRSWLSSGLETVARRNNRRV